MSSLNSGNLYKWERITSKANPHRSAYSHTNVKNNAVTDDIEKWMKKVEEASDFAAAQAFGKARKNCNTKTSILATVDQLHDHDAAYEEAQQLLNDWVETQFDLNCEDETEKKIWSDEENDPADTFEPSIQNIIQQTDAGALSMEEYEHLMNIDNYNEDSAVQSVLDQLRGKEVVNKDFLLDLGDIGGKPTYVKPKKDPSIKMQMRQTQLKETREKKRLEVLKKNEQELVRKEAIHKAKQQAAEKRRKAALKAKAEEIEIQKEMTRIRKELQEERRQQLRKQEEEKELEKRIAQVAKSQIENNQNLHSNKNSSNSNSMPASSDNLQLYHERKKRLVKAIEVAETKYASKNFKLLRTYFHSWLDIVLERRIQMGKARAVSEWKCLFRTFNAWHHYTKDNKLELLRQKHETNMVEDHRKHQQAINHYNQTLLKKSMLQWLLWVAQQKQLHDLEKDKLSVRQKMSAFLQTGQRLAIEKTHNDQNEDTMTTRDEVEDMFKNKSTKENIFKTRQKRQQNKKMVTEPWQVTRRQLKLSSKQISTLTDGSSSADLPQSRDAWEEAVNDTPVKSPKAVPKSFQNRFEAQQKILQEQQKTLKEQKKMIEELMFKQDKNLLEQQIQEQKIIQQQLEKLTKLTLQEQRLNDVVPKTPNTVSSPQTLMDHVDEEVEEVVPSTARTGTTVSVNSKVTAASSSFSKKMEQRAMERAQAKQEREEKKRKQEEQRVAELIAKEEEQRQQEAEEKRKRIEAYREKKRLEKQKELELQQQREKALANQKIAEEHSRLRVMNFYGFSQLKLHHSVMKEKKSIAERQYHYNMLRETFQLWHLRYEANESLRNERADDLHNQHLVRRCFKNWTQWKLQSQILTIKADRYYQNKLISEVFKTWLDLTTKEKIETWEKERRARQHDVVRLKSWVMRTWKRLPEEKRQEIEKEKRREEMRRKVSSLIPDFNTKTVNSE